MTDILAYMLQHYPHVAIAVAALTALVTGASLICKAAEMVAGALKAKSKRAAQVDAGLLKAMAWLARVQRWVGMVALNPKPAAPVAAEEKA